MLDWLRLLGALFNASEVIDGRLVIKLTVDIQDAAGNAISLPSSNTP